MDGQPPVLPPDPPQPPATAPPSLPPPPPPPGERPLPLQPMGVGELLDAAIKLYRSQWKSLLGIAAILLVPITFLQAFLTRSVGGPFTTEPAPITSEGALVAASVIAVLQFLFVQPLLTAAVARASAEAYLGNRVLVGPTLRFALTRVHSILWISILSSLAALLGFILLIVPGIIVLVRFAFGSTVLVVERRKGSKALGRSWRLAKGHFWKLFGVFILAFLMAGIVASVLSIPAGLAFAAIGPSGWPIAAVGDSLAGVLTTPFTTLITVLLYFDLRIRKEAFDLEVMAQEIAATR